jgi:stage V sporulation protein G
MKITDVKVFPVDEDKLKAYATITFENCFIVRDLKVISGNKGYFIAMPSKKRKDGTFRDVAHPLNSETRKMIEDSVLEVYERENVSVPAPESYSEDTSIETESTPMDTESDSTDVGSDSMDIEDGSTGFESEAVDSPVDSVEDSVDEETDAMEFHGDVLETDTADTEPGEIAETTADPEIEEYMEEEAVVESTEPVEPDQPEEREKGAEENPVIEGSDDPEKAFGYEE